MGPGFTRAFREELARVEEKQPCCRLAAVAGLMHTAGSFLIRGGSTEDERYEIRIATTVQAAAKLAYSVVQGASAPRASCSPGASRGSSTAWSTRCT